MIRKNAQVSLGWWNQGNNAYPSSVIGQKRDEANNGECDSFLEWLEMVI